MIGALITVAVVLLLLVGPPVLALRRYRATRRSMERLERRLAVLEDLVLRGQPLDVATVPEPGATDAATGATPDPAPSVASADPVGTAAGPSATSPTPPERPPTTPTRLETRIGTQWMLYVGVATLVIGVGLFVRYAFVNQWVTEPMRVGIGVLTGLLLILSGRRFATAGQGRFGHTLVGGGIVTWYLALYAALNLYALVTPVTGFSLLVLVTVLAATQADRLRSEALATIAVVGGYGTPLLVGFGPNTQVTLLAYTAGLIAAIVYFAGRRDWPTLNLISFLLTGLLVTVWHVGFYRPSLYLTTELFFTLYCGLFLWVLYRMRQSSHAVAPWVRLALWTTPVWYHGASLAILGDQWLGLFVYLIAVTGVGMVVSVRWEAMWPRLLLWAAVVVPLLDWTTVQPDGSWLAPAVVTWIAVAGMHAYAQIELLRRVRARLHAADVLLIPANGLGLYVGLQAVLDPHLPAVTGLIAAVLALAYGGLTVLTRRIRTHAAMHVLVVAVTLAVVAVAVQLDGAWWTMLWAAEGGGLIWVGLRERRGWIGALGALLLGASVIGLLRMQLAAVPATYTVFLNQRAALGLFIVGVLSLVAWLHAHTDPNAVSHRRLAIATAVVTANVLMLALLSTEIHAFWELRGDTVRFASSAELIRQMMLSATWGVYAAALTAVGIKRRYAPIRFLALVVFGITVLKVFIVDFSQLDSVYRIVSSIALGLLLMGASYLYQRYDPWLGDGGTDDEPPAAASPTDASMSSMSEQPDTSPSAPGPNSHRG